MSRYEEYRDRVIAAQEQWNRDRTTIYSYNNNFQQSFNGQFEQPKISGPDPFDAMSLEEMISGVDAMQPEVVRAASDAWLNIGANLGGALDTFSKEFARTVHGDGTHTGWTGVASQAAVDAVNSYSQRSTTLASAALLISTKLSEMQTGLEQTKALMPRLSARPDLTDKVLPQGLEMKEGDYTRQEVEEEARRILTTVYGQVATQTDQNVPVLPSAPVIATDAGQPATMTAGTNSGAPQGVPGQPGIPGDQPKAEEKPQDKPGQQPVTAQPASTTPQSTDTSKSDTAKSTQQTGNPSTTQNSPSTTNTPSTTTNRPSTTTRPSTPTNTGRPGPGPGPGTPGGPRSNVPNSQGIPGRSVPGSPLQPGMVPAAARQGGPSGRPGMAGTPGYAPAAGAQRQDEERQKGIPDYLVTKEHGEELTGLGSLPQAVPPVIGGD